MPLPVLLDRVEMELLDLVERRLERYGLILGRAPQEERCVVVWRGVRMLRNEERPEQSAKAFFDETLRPQLELRLQGKAEDVSPALDRMSFYLDLGARVSEKH